MQVDADIVAMLFGVESHGGLLSEVSWYPRFYRVGRNEGASIQYPLAAGDAGLTPRLKFTSNVRAPGPGRWTIQFGQETQEGASNENTKYTPDRTA